MIVLYPVFKPMAEAEELKKGVDLIMWYFIDGFVLYFGVIAAGYGFIWCTRNVSRCIRRRRNAKRLRQDLRIHPLDYAGKEALRKKARGMVNGSSYHVYNKEALGRMMRNVTTKGKNND